MTQRQLSVEEIREALDQIIVTNGTVDDDGTVHVTLIGMYGHRLKIDAPCIGTIDDEVEA